MLSDEALRGRIGAWRASLEENALLWADAERYWLAVCATIALMPLVFVVLYVLYRCCVCCCRSADRKRRTTDKRHDSLRRVALNTLVGVLIVVNL